MRIFQNCNQKIFRKRDDLLFSDGINRKLWRKFRPHIENCRNIKTFLKNSFENYEDSRFHYKKI